MWLLCPSSVPSKRDPSNGDTMNRLRRAVGIVTSPIFVPLRRFVAWGDRNFGTCDHHLEVVERQPPIDPHAGLK